MFAYRLNKTRSLYERTDIVGKTRSVCVCRAAWRGVHCRWFTLLLLAAARAASRKRYSALLIINILYIYNAYLRVRWWQACLRKGRASGVCGQWRAERACRLVCGAVLWGRLLQKMPMQEKKLSEALHGMGGKPIFAPDFKGRTQGKVLEWLKRHAWKACKRLKRFVGSNPILSAFTSPYVTNRGRGSRKRLRGFS